MVICFKTMAEFNTMLENSKSKTAVLDFTATWHPRCKMIGPIFEAMAGEFPGVAFFKVDVDKAKEVAAKCGIQAMPAFQVFKGGEMAEEMQGADQAGLKNLVTKHQ